MKINRHGLQFGCRDVWDYTYLGDVMVRWLKTFKKHGKMGCPSQYLPPSDTGDYSDEQIEEGLQKLYKDIDDLIWALEDEHEPIMKVGRITRLNLRSTIMSGRKNFNCSLNFIQCCGSNYESLYPR